MHAAVAAFVLALGAWTVQFDQESQQLSLTNGDANVQVVGTLGFTSGGTAWRIENPRDGYDKRLVVVDGNNDAQGYVAFNAQGDRLEALFYHRTRQFYSGTWTFNGTVTTPENGFACRTNAKDGERVLALASGNADSALFDSIFCTDSDLAVKFRAANLSLGTKDAKTFSVSASGKIEESAEASFTIECDADYFQKRWVPYYAPIDRKRCPKAPTGWLSWNTYFDKATAEDNLAEARIGKRFLQPFGCEYWEIESWQGNSDQLPVSDFYNLDLEVNEKQFPEGMKKLADDIRALGFKPGIWTAPFGTGNKEFYEAHKDWFLHDKDGNPLRTWNGRYTIDPSNDEVVEHIRHIHDVAAHDWGYEYFKIDGMSGSGPGYSAHFFERPEVRAAFKDPTIEAPFERCVKALREGIGDDRVFLACQGHFTGAEAKYADAARTGADIVSPNEPVKWANIMQQAGRTLNQVFVNNIVFYSDPDNLLVNDALSLEEARVTTTIVALPGQLTFFGDHLGRLQPSRMKLLQQTLPVCDVRPGALYPYFSNLPVWDLKIGRSFGSWDVVALFNWTEEEDTISVTKQELGLEPGKYVGYEFWTRQFLGEVEDKLEARVPAHAVRLVALRKALGRPQFMSSDRHVTQGGVDLVDEVWNADTQTLSLTLNLIENNSTTVKIYVPENCTFELGKATCETKKAYLDADGKVLSFEAFSETTGDYTIDVSFKK